MNEMNVIAKPHDVVILMVVSAGQSFVLCTLFLSINWVIAMVFSAFKKNIAALGILVDSSVPFEIRIFCFIL